jgi:hypothetical protein
MSEEPRLARVDRNDLPYPWLGPGDPTAVDPSTVGPLKGRRNMKVAEYQGALAAQPTSVSLPHTRFAFKATLCLYQDSVGLYCHDGPWAGEWRGFSYEQLDWFRVRGVLRFRKLTLQDKEGTMIHCRVGERMAANAQHVFNAKGVPTK